MPVRSLNSSVLVWPHPEQVIGAALRWAQAAAGERPEVLRIGYFGSYARGDAGVGSDLDLVVIVTSSAVPFHRRGVTWDTTSLPVPVDLLVYSSDEWAQLAERGSAFARTLRVETQWLVARSE